MLSVAGRLYDTDSLRANALKAQLELDSGGGSVLSCGNTVVIMFFHYDSSQLHPPSSLDARSHV